MTNDSRFYIQNSILKCQRGQEFPKFFLSLMDYKNNYFLSKNPKDIIHFYEGFENRKELIDWMKERPKGSCEIMEVEGEKDIIVVIPTADFEGEYAKRCREDVFKGLHMIFVVSGIGNNYFNIAHNSNIGIKKAMEYNPKWIVFSNDDMYKIDDVEILINELNRMEPKKINVIFTNPSSYHSHYVRMAKANFLFYIYFYITNKNMFRNFRKILKENKLNIVYDQVPFDSKISYLFKKGYNLINFESFGIFSYNYISSINGELFDETFINAGEDVDVSLNLSLQPNKIGMINYKIGNYVGGTLGNDVTRALRTHAGRIYLNYKWENKLYELIKGKGKN